MSPKTVRKHLDSLIRSETIVIMPRLGTGSSSGELVYNLAVAGKVPMSEIRKILDDTLLVHETRNPPMKYLLCRSTDLGEANSKTRALNRLQGVQSATVTLNRELVFANEFIHSLVRERIRALEKTRESQALFAEKKALYATLRDHRRYRNCTVLAGEERATCSP